MQDAFAHCEALVRAGDRDRFLATLFAPAERRRALFALYAFNLEIVRIRDAAHQPLAGEIRLQWWSDVLRGQRAGEGQGHPVATALLLTQTKYGLDAERLEALIDARRFDLYDEPMRTLPELEAYAEATWAGLISMAAQILDGERRLDLDALCSHAGIAHAVAGLLDAFPAHARRGQLYIPLDLLERHGCAAADALRDRESAGVRAAFAELLLVARRHLALARELCNDLPAALVPAFLPLAPVPSMLDRLERSGQVASADIAPWRRQWLIWRAARQPGRLLG